MNDYTVYGCLVHGWRALGVPCPSCAEADEKARQPARVAAKCGGQLGFWHKGRLPIQAALLLALAGCTTTRYVPTPCLERDQLDRLKSAEPERIGSRLTGQAQDDLKIIAESNVRLRSYSHGLLGVLEGCVDK